MAFADIGRSFVRPSWPVLCRPCLRALRQQLQTRRASSSQTLPLDELESSSSLSIASSPSDGLPQYDPLAASRSRKKQLPSSRYKFRPPKYYRGPLHPHQPPPPSDPASREFVPGPFTSPRLEQTYHSTIASDLLALTYSHVPDGFKPEYAPRLRSWVGDSPYFKNRPLRAPRGGHALRPVHKPITFRNVPRLEKIVVHTMASEASSQNDSSYLHVAGMVVQAITNVRVTTHAARTAVSQWGLKKGRFVSVTAELEREDMYHFLGKLVDLVLPRIKDWKGVKGTTGDSTGNLSFGLTNEAVALFPEIEVNYDMYPPKMIPGCHITIQTSAKRDKEARLLLMSMGVPFYGEFVD